MPHILQIIDCEFEKKLTLTHRVQVRRFSNDLLKVLKSHSNSAHMSSSSKEMFADEFSAAYEKHFSRKFDIRDYGVCFLEDMLAELPDNVISRKEIDSRTFLQMPRVVQQSDEKMCMARLTLDICDMLRQRPRFSIQFSKFIPNFHHHFGRQCKLSNYGFAKLIDLLEAMPDTVQLFFKDGVQFVQLSQEIMLDLITLNLVKIVEDYKCRLTLSLQKLEEIYYSKHELICFQDFGLGSFLELFSVLPLGKHFIGASMTHQNEWTLIVEPLNETELKRTAKLLLRKLMDEMESLVLQKISEFRAISNDKHFDFGHLFDLIMSRNDSTESSSNKISSGGQRAQNFLFKCLIVFFKLGASGGAKDDLIVGFSEMYYFAKKIRCIYKTSNKLDMNIGELESFYSNVLKEPQQQSQKGSLVSSVSNGNSSLNSSGSEGCGDAANSFDSVVFPCKRMGYVDTNLLFTQGLKLLVSIKKFNDRRICLNKEFWPKQFLVVTQSSESFTSPISTRHIKSNHINDYRSNQYLMPPITQQIASKSDFISPSLSQDSFSLIADSSSQENFARRSILKTFSNLN
jgi:hypothetical protein